MPTLKPNTSIAYNEGISKWCKSQLSSRPEYYSGRGVRTGDLNAKHLKMLHDGIKAELGDNYAKAFCNFVNSIQDMSATAFLIAYQRFASAGYVFRAARKTQFKGENIAIGGGTDEQKQVSAMCTLASVMFGDQDSPQMVKIKSNSIKNEFMHSVGDKRAKSGRTGQYIVGFGGFQHYL